MTRRLSSDGSGFAVMPFMRRAAWRLLMAIVVLGATLVYGVAANAQARGRGGGSAAPATNPAGEDSVDIGTVSPGFSRGGFSASTVGGRGGARGGGRGSGRGSVPALREGPTCSLDATLYDVRLPADQIGRLDPAALAEAATSAASFETALAQLGTSRPLYRASQSVRLAGDTITIGSSTPYVTGTTASRGDRPVRQISYSEVGAVFDISGRAGSAPGSIELDLAIQVSALSEGTTPVGEGVTAPMFRRASMSHKGLVAAQRPFVVMSVDAASRDTEGRAVAYIARVALGTLQEGTP